MEEWIKCPLRDILNFRRGHDLPKTSMIPGDIPVAGSNGIIGFHNVATPISPCITIGRSGNVGTPYIYDKCWAHNTVLYIDDHKGNDPRYLYYLLKTLPLASFGGGSAVPTLNRNHIHPLEVVFCKDIELQKKIAGILSKIDDKIELNRQINDNLEQQAQALYKSWFVDFEPFKDCEFVDSELGLIPKGWQVGTYEQIIQTTISGDWGKDIITGNYTHKVACVRGCDFQDMSIGVRGKTPERYILEKNYQAKRLIDNDVIVEISGGTSTISTGRVCLINADLLGKYNNDIVCTNFCKVVRPIQSYGAYLYYSWKYKYDCRVMFGYENGTSGIKNFQISDFLSKEPVIIPSESSIKEFQMIIDTLQNNIQTNGSEIMKLESLRDSLLPKLMSGEIKINEIDC